MANGAQPAAGGHWIAAAPPNLRDRVVQKMMKNLPQGLHVKDPQGIIFAYEDKVFSKSHNLEDYLRTISMKMISLHQKWKPVVQPASDHQQQAQMGHQMRHLNAVLPNSVSAAMPGTASTIPLTVRSPQVRNIHNQSNPSNIPPVAPVVQQLHPRHPVVSQNNRQFGHPEVQSSQQFGHPVVQNSQQFGHPAVGEVDWREAMFQKITSLKDAHLSELMEFGRAVRARFPQGKTNEQLKSLPKEQAAVNIMARITCVSSFLQLQKSNIPELAKDQLDRFQTNLYGLLQFYRGIKAKSVGRQSLQYCHDLPRVTGATDSSQQNHQEQPAAEAFLQSSQNVPATSPLAQQQNHSDHLADEPGNDEVRHEAEAPVAINVTAFTGDTAAFLVETCNQEIWQEHPINEAIPQLTQNVDPGETPPAQQQTDSTARVEWEDEEVSAKAETLVVVEVAKTSLSPAALHSLASDMGVNMKRAFCHTMSGTMDGSGCVPFDDEPSRKSCHKRPKTHGGTLLDEIRNTHNMLIQTLISISEHDTGRADGTVIELCCNDVSLAPNLREAIGASGISTKLLVPADYPRSSPVILGGDGEQKQGVPAVVDVAFRRALVLLHGPRSIEETARAWDSVVRRAAMLFAHRLGGGMFSSRYGCSEICIPV